MVLMRVLFCKIHCPSFICFCKPSPHLYTPGPLKLENSPHVPETEVVLGANGSDNNSLRRDDSVTIEGQEETVADVNRNFRKSSLKKGDSGEEEAQKKKVQWMDFMGKELVQIREFESSEIEDSNSEDDENRSCVCVIL